MLSADGNTVSDPFADSELRDILHRLFLSRRTASLKIILAFPQWALTDASLFPCVTKAAVFVRPEAW
jgi:hypothetical protein